MTEQQLTPHECAEFNAFLAEGRLHLSYSGQFREFGLLVGEGPVLQELRFCPWCGEEFSPSLREEFFDLLEAMGHEHDSPDLPLDFRTDA